MLRLNSKHVQHVKIYLACNFKVNLIIHLEVIAQAVSEEKIVLNSNQSETRIALGGHICWWNGTKWRNFIRKHLCKILYKLIHLVPFGQQTWPPGLILFSDWLIGVRGMVFNATFNNIVAFSFKFILILEAQPTEPVSLT
jgi:hypothetical protein